MTNKDDTYIASTLQRLGLSVHEAAVYQICLRYGEMKIMEIAKRTGISRTTIYGVADDLVGKGLLHFVQKGAHRIYSAADPRRLEGMLEKAKASLERKQDFLQSILPALSMQFMSGAHKPVVSYYQGQTEVRQIFEDFLASGATEILFIGEAATIQEAIGSHYLREVVKRRIEKGIEAWGIRTEDTEVDDPLYRSGPKRLRRVRIAPANLKSPVYTAIYGNRVFFVSSIVESYGVMVESKDLAETFRSWFRLMWESLKPSR